MSRSARIIIRSLLLITYLVLSAAALYFWIFQAVFFLGLPWTMPATFLVAILAHAVGGNSDYFVAVGCLVLNAVILLFYWYRGWKMNKII